MTDNPLGEKTPNPGNYDPSILYPIPRLAGRSLLNIDKSTSMYGIDHWRAYELSWLDANGKPQVAIGEFYFNSDSDYMIESKSLKLYLNSLNQERYADAEEVRSLIENDLSNTCQSPTEVVLCSLDKTSNNWSQSRAGCCLDGNEINADAGPANPDGLELAGIPVIDEQLYSDLFKSNCPVTGQPDWASIEIRYTGEKIVESSLLSYLCSYRNHQGYHEECAERIFRDIMQKCQPDELRVAMNFLRRGGLDINVYRSTLPLTSNSVNSRTIRQ